MMPLVLCSKQVIPVKVRALQVLRVGGLPPRRQSFKRSQVSLRGPMPMTCTPYLGIPPVEVRHIEKQ